ncbi:DUF4124 domain-containing protein [Psychromonas sp.]|uniref:DUF4124 domain-containing protein n=1 Tax=Psychromonas sp. TaxID=1884585 RepID=UPI0039E715B5
MPSVIIILTFLFSCSVFADLYTWKDEQGVTHFSENKPDREFKTITNDFHSHKTYQQGVEISYDLEVLTQATESAENSRLDEQTTLNKDFEAIQK